MAQDSVVAAALELYDTLTAGEFPGAARPPAYLGEAPINTTAGVRLSLPYVVFKDDGGGYEPTFDGGDIETRRLTVEVYAKTAADCITIVDAIRWNGLSMGSYAGFDRGTLALTAPRVFLQMLPGDEQQSFAGYDKAGARVHTIVRHYTVTSLVLA